MSTDVVRQNMALAAAAAVINLPIRERPVWQAQPA